VGERPRQAAKRAAQRSRDVEQMQNTEVAVMDNAPDVQEFYIFRSETKGL
jgi:hypothetical protein